MVNKLIYKKAENGWLKKRKEFNKETFEDKIGDFYLNEITTCTTSVHTRVLLDREFNGPIIGKRGMLEYVFNSLNFMCKSFVFMYGTMLKIPYFLL